MGFSNGQPIDQSTGQYWDWRGKDSSMSSSMGGFGGISSSSSSSSSSVRALESLLSGAEHRYEKLVEKYNQLREEVDFERDCRDAAVEEVAAHSSYSLRRGHIIVDDRLLVEHWWVTSNERIIDPSLMNTRGASRVRNSLEYLPLDPEGEEFDFSLGPPVCMRTWGKCQTKPPCDWCVARAKILKKKPDLVPATITIQFAVAEKPGPWGRDLDL